MDLQNNIRYYYMTKALHFLLEKGNLTDQECDAACRRLAEIYQPDPEYIQ